MASSRTMACCLAVFTTLTLRAFAAAPPAITLQKEPKPAQQRVLDKKYFAVMGFEFSGLVGDYYSTTICLRSPDFRETDSWLGQHPSTLRLTTEGLGIFAGEAFATYELKKPHDWLPFDKRIRRFWWVYPVASGVQHFVLAYHNMELYNQSKVRH